ncbi:MAG TPA: Imm21 family immunity protein [Pyrinomonadaceae bacterium]|nr:Imm21 family immunity protein [Pyrinomonadaceae bacterium]
MRHESSVVWIESAGGPLLLLEENLLAHWHGCFSNSEDTPTDYDRACDVDGDIGIIAVGSGQGIVLGEEPFSTAWWPLAKLGEGLLVRWVYAESEAAVIRALENLPSAAWLRTDVEFQVSNGKLLLFDAACSGSDIDERLEIEIRKGCYVAETLPYQPDEQTSLILHRFVATPGA